MYAVPSSTQSTKDATLHTFSVSITPNAPSTLPTKEFTAIYRVTHGNLTSFEWVVLST